MSLLSVANDVCDIIGIERQVAIAVGTGGDARQLFRLCRLELSELARRTSWQALIKQKDFNAEAQTIQPNALTADHLFMVPETLFNRTGNHEVFGPISPRDYQAIVAIGSGATAVNQLFRIQGNQLYLVPTPTAGDLYAYEYVSAFLATAADLETEKRNYALDTDVAKLDEELIKLGVVHRWKNLKGLDYAEDFRTYEMQVANSIARDGGKRTISMDGSRPPGVPVFGLPAGNWTP